MKTRNEIVNEIVKLMKQHTYRYELRKYLTKEGVAESDFESIIDEARAIYTIKVSKRRRITWISLSVLTFVIFYFLIPISMANAIPLLISFVGGAVLFFFVTQSIADFKSFEELNTKDPAKQDWRHKYTPFLVIPGLVITFVFYMHFSSMEKKELKKYGVKVKATILDGSSYKSRRGGTYNVTVSFVTKGGRKMEVDESVGESEFGRFYKGQEIELIYSSRDPEIIELLTNDSTVKEYLGSEERELLPKDMMDLLKLERKEIGNHLNKIFYGWNYSAQDSLWLNERKNCAISIKPKKEIRFVTYEGAFMTFPDKFKEMGFNALGEESNKLRVYDSEEFMASIEIVQDGIRIASVATILKKGSSTLPE